MNGFESRLALLLKDAPGEPPLTVDPDRLLAALSARSAARARLMSAAAVVVVVAVLAAVLMRDSRSPAHRSMVGSAPVPAGPQAVAQRQAKAIVAAAPVPPGATRSARAPVAGLGQPAAVPEAQHVQATRFWTTSGTVDGVIAYLRAHPPKGMKQSGSSTAGGQHGSTVETVEFESDGLHSLEYAVVATPSGVAVRADAQVLWAPARSPMDEVPASVTAVDVLVVRHSGGRDRAPVVHRTVTGAAARRLVRLVDSLPVAIPVAYYCPSLNTNDRRLDRLIFRGDGPLATFVVYLAGCARAQLTVGSRRPVQLSHSFPAMIKDVDRAILDVLGLPANYGH